MYDLSHKLQPAPTPTPTPSAASAISMTGASTSSSSSAPLPYEFRALEAVLISVTSALEAEFEGVREPVVRVLRELEEDIDRDKLRHLLIFSKKLGTFEQKAQLVRDAIDELLDADDDLAAMYLSEKASSSEGKGRGEDDHTEVEMLLESYHKVCDEIVQASGNLVSNIRNTEEMCVFFVSWFELTSSLILHPFVDSTLTPTLSLSSHNPTFSLNHSLTPAALALQQTE